MLLVRMQVVELLAKVQCLDAWHSAVYAELPGLIIRGLYYAPEFLVCLSRAYDKGLSLKFRVPYLFACGKEIIHINIKYKNHLKHYEAFNLIPLCIAIAALQSIIYSLPCN